MSRAPTDLEAAAWRIAIYPPTHRGDNQRAYVSWDAIDALREALRQAGWEVDGGLIERDRRRRERTAARFAKYDREQSRQKSEGDPR